MNAISIKDVSFGYKEDVNVLEHISLEVEQGSFIAIIGHNGSGKSTLAKHMNALYLPKTGSVHIMGNSTADPKKTIAIRSCAGMVFQNPDNQMVTTIVEEDVAFGPENLGIPSPEIRKRVDAALAQVNMQDFKRAQPHNLSGGQKQRIAIAGVLAMRPQIIILDEPTAMLDPLGRKEVMDAALELHQQGITLVLITHFMEEAALADCIAVMDKGKIVLRGTPKEVFAQRDTLRKIGLDVPFVQKVAYTLQAQGLDLQLSDLSHEALVEAICQLK